jgi:tetratricopeptide (TPR) repeat protein
MFKQFNEFLMYYENKLKLFIAALEKTFHEKLQNVSKRNIAIGIAILGIILIAIIGNSVKSGANLDNPEYLFKRGSEHFLKERYKEAIADYTEALRINPTNINYLFGRGSSYLLNKEYDNAIADFSTALILKPDYPPYIFGRGNSYLLKEDYNSYSRAIADYELILRIDPHHAGAKTNLKLARDKIAAF